MAYEKKEQLYEGKAKKVYATDDPEVVIEMCIRDSSPASAWAAAHCC